MWFLVGLSIFAMIVKALAGRRLYKSRNAPVCLLALLILFVSYAQSALELYGYYKVVNPGSLDAALLLRVYHVFVAVFLVLMVPLSHAVIKGSIRLAHIGIIASLLLSLCVWMITSDKFILGYEILSQAYTRIPGPHYWVFQITALSSLVAAIVLPIFIYRRTNKEMERVKSANILTGITLVAVVYCALIALRAAGVPITVAGILPVALAFYLLIVAECLNDYMVRDLRVDLWFWSAEFKEERRITRHLRYKQIGQLDAKQSTEDYLYSLISNTHKVHGKQADTARALKLSKASISRKLSEIEKTEK